MHLDETPNSGVILRRLLLPSPLRYNLCKNGLSFVARAYSRPSKNTVLIIDGPGVHNCHNDYKPRCRCFDLGIELSYPLISLMASPFSPVQLEWVRHCQ